MRFKLFHLLAALCVTVQLNAQLSENAKEALEDPANTTYLTLSLSDVNNQVFLDALDQFTNLETLNFPAYEMSQVPDDYGKIKSLKEVDFGYANSYHEIPRFVYQLPNLEVLSIQSKSIQITDEINRLKNLKELWLTRSDLENLPENLSLGELEELYIYDNYLTQIPKSANFPKLRKIAIGKNPFQYETLVMFNETLEELLIGGAGLTEVPRELKLLTNLTLLSLDNNDLTSIPAFMADFQKLEWLKLHANNITEISPELAQLETLKTLNLWSNDMKAIPEGIYSLSQIEELDLSGNQIKSMSSDIGQLTNLRVLNLNDNQLSDLPNSIVSLSNLTRLLLEENTFEKAPEVLSKLPNNVEVDIEFDITQIESRFSSLEEALAKPDQVISLSLSYSGLNVLPESIGIFQNLKDLDVRSNELTELPSSLWTLSNLETIYLSSNKLTSLPSDIGKLKKLRFLELQWNPLTHLPTHALSELNSLETIYLNKGEYPPPGTPESTIENPGKLDEETRQGLAELYPKTKIFVDVAVDGAMGGEYLYHWYTGEDATHFDMHPSEGCEYMVFNMLNIAPLEITENNISDWKALFRSEELAHQSSIDSLGYGPEYQQIMIKAGQNWVPQQKIHFSQDAYTEFFNKHKGEINNFELMLINGDRRYTYIINSLGLRSTLDYWNEYKCN